MCDKIILNCKINTHVNWVARVKFLQETGPKRAQEAKSMVIKEDINILHAELGHFSKVITHATGRVMGLLSHVC